MKHSINNLITGKHEESDSEHQVENAFLNKTDGDNDMLKAQVRTMEQEGKGTSKYLISLDDDVVTNNHFTRGMFKLYF